MKWGLGVLQFHSTIHEPPLVLNQGEICTVQIIERQTRRLINYINIFKVVYLQIIKLSYHEGIAQKSFKE